ncbi:MAG: 30S ribosomal protein S16 [Bacteroidales bacterium]|jgi:small subunit ribosomal protein S16|nr:30S ribosomal protein S16 [Bacteroidales bacterium]
MAVRLRLARHGRKTRPYYYIVATDNRSPRDGKFIERIGSYNPVTNPATIELDFDRALTWLNNGAQPSDTVRRILSYKGVLMKKHLLEGVKKGAFDETEAEKRFNAWLEEKNSKIRSKVSDLESAKRTESKAKLEAETKVKEKRAEAIAKKQLEAMNALKEESAEEVPANEDNTTEEVVADTTTAEETTEERSEE